MVHFKNFKFIYTKACTSGSFTSTTDNISWHDYTKSYLLIPLLIDIQVLFKLLLLKPMLH